MFVLGTWTHIYTISFFMSERFLVEEFSPNETEAEILSKESSSS